jgi:hypothetical protein
MAKIVRQIVGNLTNDDIFASLYLWNALILVVEDLVYDGLFSLKGHISPAPRLKLKFYF